MGKLIPTKTPSGEAVFDSGCPDAGDIACPGHPLQDGTKPCDDQCATDATVDTVDHTDHGGGKYTIVI